VHFSFSRFLSVSSHIPGSTVFVSHFPDVSVFSPYSRFYSLHFSFSRFSVFLAIFQVPQCVFLIFHDFHYSRHTPGPTECISHFPCFSVYLAILHVIQFLHLSLNVFTFLAIIRVLPCVFLFFFTFFRVS
jgi:hypothetical protein